MTFCGDIIQPMMPSMANPERGVVIVVCWCDIRKIIRVQAHNTFLGQVRVLLFFFRKGHGKLLRNFKQGNENDQVCIFK